MSENNEKQATPVTEASLYEIWERLKVLGEPKATPTQAFIFGYVDFKDFPNPEETEQNLFWEFSSNDIAVRGLLDKMTGMIKRPLGGIFG